MKKGTEERLIIFTRYPEAGKVKTRLIPKLGAEGAADVHRWMAEHTYAQACELASRRALTGRKNSHSGPNSEEGGDAEVRSSGECAVDIEVWHEGGDERAMEEWLGIDVECRPQGGGDLGDRMAQAFARAFNEGARRIVIVGADCPGLTADIMEQAFERLQGNDVVVGPAADGGYYLIGLARLVPDLFMDIPWGTDRVLRRTLAAAKRRRCMTAKLDELTDVDRPEDLAHLRKFFDVAPQVSQPGSLSIIIPTLDEAANVEAVLASVAREADVEAIVVDGGSRDGTVDIAKRCGAKVVVSGRGRAAQMNAGADVARGEILLFCHADTRLPDHYASFVHQALTDDGVVAGAFSFRTDHPGTGMRIVEWLANFRSRRMRMPYGDQAIFVRKDVFEDVGGFPNVSIMEDYEFIRRIRKRGRIVTLDEAAVTSGRRWVERGVLRTTATNQAVIVGYRLGVSPEWLRKWYGGKEGA